MATNPTVEGDGTSLHISTCWRFAVHYRSPGVTTGSVLEFANKISPTLTKSGGSFRENQLELSVIGTVFFRNRKLTVP
jgi:recombinational DNA repair protein RecR